MHLIEGQAPKEIEWVSQLILEYLKKWNETLIAQIFYPQSILWIKQISLAQNDPQDLMSRAYEQKG